MLGSMMPGSVPSRAKAQWKLALKVTLAFSSIFLAFIQPGIVSVDGASMLAVSESLVTHQGLTVPPNLGRPGRDGRIYSTWYPLLSFISVPFVAVALIASRAAHLPFHYLAPIFALLLPVLLTSATAGIVVLLTIRLGGDERKAWVAALCFMFGTTAMVYVRSFYTEPLLGFLVAAATYLALGATAREIRWAAVLAVLAVLAKPTGIVLGPVLSCYLLAKRFKPQLACLPLIGTAAGFGLYCFYNYVRFGSVASFGPKLEFSLRAIPKGIAGLMLSPGWGLVWYSPVLILSISGFRKLWRTKPMEALAIGGGFAGFLLIDSYWSYWSGGWSWGPRLLYPAIPGLCVLAGLVEGRMRRALVALSLAGFLVNAPTLVSFYERYFTEMSESGVDVNSYAWSVQKAPLLHGYQAAQHQIEDARGADVRQIYREREIPGTTIATSRAFRVVAIWWWVLPAAGLPRWAGALVALLLIGMGCCLLIRAAPAPTRTVAMEPTVP
jgi:hypothetical protein